MAKAKEQEKRARRVNSRVTPQKEEVKVIGSGSTWGESELERFRVKVSRDVDVRNTMIPNKFFEFNHLPRYEECSSSAYYEFWRRLGETELCAPSAKEATDSSFASEINNKSYIVFEALCQILALQSTIRNENISQKRSKYASLSAKSIPLFLSSIDYYRGFYYCCVGRHWIIIRVLHHALEFPQSCL